MGSIKVSKGTFPPGAVLTISSPKKDPKVSEEDDGSKGGCSKNGKKTVTRQSSVIDITVTNAKSKDFKKPVKINLALNDDSNNSKKNKNSRLCLASTNDPENAPLKCDDNGEKNKGKGKGKGKGRFNEGETTHFTTFAFLLFSDGEDDCGDGWIWPTSVGLVAGAIVVSLLLGFVLSLRWFRPLIAGHFAGRISQLVQKVESAQEGSQVSV